MGVKSTKQITRAEAERRYVDLHVRNKAADRRAKAEHRIRDAGWLGTPYIHGTDLDLDEKVIAEIYHHVDAKIREDDWRVKARIKIAPMDDETLENALEELNDEVHGGEGFENYIITEHGRDD